MRRLAPLILALAPGLAMAQAAAPPADTPWPLVLTDPAAEATPPAPADLMLPLPCGGAMAFQRVSVPVDTAHPLSDRQVRLGQSDQATAFSDYLLPSHLRGPFTDSTNGVSYYYIARYEVTVGQYRALTGACDGGFGPRDRFAKGDLSWFDAVDLTRRMTEWLLASAPDALPKEGARTAFVRLPTEVEWEYAARGGARIDPTLFPARRFFAEGSLTDYAHFQSAGQARSKLQPVGLRQPNPLGLFDIYGNTEELMLEPYRMNAVGRSHGQTGGMVTRGGSIDSTDEQIYTAQRREYPMFDPRKGTALVGAFFGLRPVLSAQIVTDANYTDLRDQWIANAAGTQQAEGGNDPQTLLGRLVEQEVDPRRKQALTDLQLSFRLTQEKAETSLKQAAQSALLSGAAFVNRLRETQAEINRTQRESDNLLDRWKISLGGQRDQIKALLMASNARRDDLIKSRTSSLLVYRNTLETLSGDVPETLSESAYLTLGQQMGEADLTAVLDPLNAFWGDLPIYRANPDMTQEQLLGLALD